MAAFITEYERRLHTVLETVPNGILVVDRQGTIVLCNSETERLFGYPPGELTGKNIEILVPQKSRAIHPALRESYAHAPVKRQMGAGRDLSGRRMDGTEFPVEIGLNPVTTRAGSFVVASVVDITQRKRQERQLQDAYEEVRRRNEEMERLIHTISHDLRSPLGVMMGFLELLREDIAEGNTALINEALERIEHANRRMKQLVDDLLQLSRAGHMELKPEPVDLNQLLATIASTHSVEAAEKYARIEIAPGFPPLTADPARLYQIFDNLLVNALKYGTDGAQPPRIQIFWEDAGEELHICIADNGPGIPPEYHKKIFGIFQRLDTKKEGTGVGLAIVSRLAVLHGGRVWLTSQPGEGASFWVALPKTPQA